MDAPEQDSDVKLYKASGELLSELRAKLPLLLRAPSGIARKWVLIGKVQEIADLLDRFQEWPQLLDPYLTTLVQDLVESFLTYCVKSSAMYMTKHTRPHEIIPLPRAIARVLYTLCKVRGQKIIVHLLNNEPRYVEPLITCFRLWGYDLLTEGSDAAYFMIWEERYIMLLWLSHLMLAPFELSSISVLGSDVAGVTSADINSKLPPVAQNLLSLSLDHIKMSSKAREAASILAVRLALRGDMQALGLPSDLVSWALKYLSVESMDHTASAYHQIGLLALLFGMANSASNADSSAFLALLSRTTHLIATSEAAQFAHVRDQAPARKLIVKIMRSTMMHALSMTRSLAPVMDTAGVETLLEETIQVLLDYLGDKDTPVRQAASKALSMIALNLDPEMSAEVVEAVLGRLNENLLLENIQSGQLIPITDILSEHTVGYRKNINAVDPLTWHGAMLTLGHLLYRRSLPIEQLNSVIETLLMGLEFEQRSNVGTSVGVGVRDAACFGLWSLARKYSTAELSKVCITNAFTQDNICLRMAFEPETIQLIASRLVVSACLDPSGNLRRGSSAALQELIGRHPDVVAQGIPVVQVVDYHAVGRRSRAMSDVASAVALLDDSYHDALIYAILQWRGSRATDAESRRHAAHTVGILFSSASSTKRSAYLQHLVAQVSNLRTPNIGSNAGARHGLLLALACVLRTSIGVSNKLEFDSTADIVCKFLHDALSFTGAVQGRVTADIEIVLEAIAEFIAAASQFVHTMKGSGKKHPVALVDLSWMPAMLKLLEICTVASEKEAVVEAAAKANVSVLTMTPDVSKQVGKWLDAKVQKQNEFTCRGRIVTLAKILGTMSSKNAASMKDELKGIPGHILFYFCELSENVKYSIEIKTNAMQSIKEVLSSNITLDDTEIRRLGSAIISGLTDYTIDQRGDIGSNLRIASIDAAQALKHRNVDPDMLLSAIKLVVKLAAERLAKVRFRAWSCLKTLADVDGPMAKLISEDGQNLSHSFYDGLEHQADVSSIAYYEATLQFLDSAKLHDSLVSGLISSVAAGTEDIGRASSEAIISTMLQRSEHGRSQLLRSMLAFVISHLHSIAGQDDREVVPTIDFLNFLVGDVLLSLSTDVDVSCNPVMLWDAIQKAHGPTSSLVRLEALIRLYGTLLDLDSMSNLSAERLSRLLLHKWPKVRTTAASQIYLHYTPSSLLYIDWHGPAASNKSVVVSLRKKLELTGFSSKPT